MFNLKNKREPFYQIEFFFTYYKKCKKGLIVSFKSAILEEC